jgi:predicted transcriptional regulator of viral defense system
MVPTCGRRSCVKRFVERVVRDGNHFSCAYAHAQVDPTLRGGRSDEFRYLNLCLKCYIIIHDIDPWKVCIMNKTITELGQKEAEFITRMASGKKPEFLIKDAVSFWGSREMAWKKLHVLERKGWIERIERGKYIIIPLEAGEERKWSEDSYLIANALIRPAVISYWSAIRHWNWTEQIPNVMYVQTTSRKSKMSKTIFGVRYEIVKVNQKKFFGFATDWRKGNKILISDREKTLIDCADIPNRAGSIEELVKAIKEGSKEISWTKLNNYARRFPSGAVKKRLGFLIEELVSPLPEEVSLILNEWRFTMTQGMSPLLPGTNAKGHYLRRWNLFVNTGV